jgi:hypothetical protein
LHSLVWELASILLLPNCPEARAKGHRAPVIDPSTILCPSQARLLEAEARNLQIIKAFLYSLEACNVGFQHPQVYVGSPVNPLYLESSVPVTGTLECASVSPYPDSCVVRDRTPEAPASTHSYLFQLPQFARGDLPVLVQFLLRHLLGVPLRRYSLLTTSAAGLARSCMLTEGSSGTLPSSSASAGSSRQVFHLLRVFQSWGQVRK